MKFNSNKKIVAAVLLIGFYSCQTVEAKVKHGLVGLRPLPRTAEESKLEWLSGIGSYDEWSGKFPFVAKNTDVLMDYKGCFKTKKAFFEHYLPFDSDWINMNPKTNPLVKKIRAVEKNGMIMEHILICREAELIGKGRRGPFPKDSRILYKKDVDDLRKLFRDAHAKGLLKHDNYKLIQMVTHASFFADDPKARDVIKKMNGVAYESHQFNRHWPIEKGWTRPKELVRGAKWTLAQDKEYIFYYGPFIYKQSKGYYDFVERDWLYKYWKAGLPKHHSNMHYYINAFPHAHGSKRPVGPESNPHSYLGMMKWLIKEIKNSPLGQ